MGMYGQPGQDPWNQPPGGRDRGPSSAARFIWVAAAAALAVLAVGGYVAATNPDLVRLADPAPASPSPAVAYSPPAPSAAPSALSPAPTPATTRPAPTPVPDPLARFAKLIADPALSYHLDAKGTIDEESHQFVFAMSVDQSGPDFAFVLDTTTNGRKTKIRAIFKDDMVYFKTPGMQWVGTDDLSTLEMPGAGLAFSQLKVDRAEYLGSESRGRTTIHHLRVPSVPPVEYSAADFARLGCRAEDLAMHIWIQDDGTPVTATMDLTCTARTVRGTSQLVMSASYEFSKVGKRIAINAPRKFRRV